MAMSSPREGRWNKNHRGIRARFADCFRDAVEHWPAFMHRAAFAGRDSADNLGSVGGAGLGMKSSFAAGEALHNQAGLAVNEN